MMPFLSPPSSPTKDMGDLLKRLENKTFAGYELSYYASTWTNMEYSPGMLKVTKTMGQKSTELELHLDTDYLVDKVIETIQKTQFHWAQANIDAREVELLDYLLNDPRHVLTHASNVQKISSGYTTRYRMQLTGPIRKKAQGSGITLYVEISMINSDIQGMDIKKKYDDTGIEELVRGVYFY